MDRQDRASEGFWFKKNKRSSSSPSRPPANLQVTLDCSAGASESGNVHLAPLGANLVTFSLANAALPEGVPTPKPLEEPKPPSTARIALGTLLVIAVVSAVTLTLGWLDGPFLPGDAHGRQGFLKNGSVDARRHRDIAARTATVGNYLVSNGVEPGSAGKAGRTPRPPLVPDMRTVGDELDDAFSSSADVDREVTVDLDEAFADSSTAVVITGG